MLGMTRKTLVRFAFVMVAIAGTSISGCAGSGPQPTTLSLTGQTQYVCRDGGKPVCTTYLGKTVECSCARRHEMERLLGSF